MGSLRRGRRRGELVWRAEPFVVATGAVVDRELEVTLHGSGAAVLREVLVLGRVREAGGVVRQRLRATASGRPLLAEDLALDGARPQVAVIGGHRVVDSVTVLGRRAGALHSQAPRTGWSSRARGRSCGTLARRRIPRRWSRYWKVVAAAPHAEPVPA